jgi:Polyketide cyclase / dehydrase and lipid transport
MAKVRSVSRSRVVSATADAVFDLLADPSQHPLIDGSGTVKAVRSDAPTRLSMGSTFGMNMKLGAPYKIENTVMEFEENRLIAWRHFGGHRWRYELEPVDGGTKVTETFDWSTSKSPFMLELMQAPKRNTKAIEKTLERLAARFAAGQ